MHVLKKASRMEERLSLIGGASKREIRGSQQQADECVEEEEDLQTGLPPRDAEVHLSSALTTRLYMCPHKAVV